MKKLVLFVAILSTSLVMASAGRCPCDRKCDAICVNNEVEARDVEEATPEVAVEEEVEATITPVAADDVEAPASTEA